MIDGPCLIASRYLVECFNVPFRSIFVATMWRADSIAMEVTVSPRTISDI